MRQFPQVNPHHFQTKTVLFIQLSLNLWMKHTRVGFVTEIKRYSSFWISFTRKRYVLLLLKKQPMVNDSFLLFIYFWYSNASKLQKKQKTKELVTLMDSPNASENFQLPLVFINRSKKPRCFKRWFYHQFVLSVKKVCSELYIEKKALLLMDNITSHSSSESSLSEDGTINYHETLLLLCSHWITVSLTPANIITRGNLIAHKILESKSEKNPVPEIRKACNIVN